MKSRLQKVLSEYGIMSRRACEDMISQGRILVNGKIAVPGEKIDPDSDKISIDGKEIYLSPPKRAYIMLNKPRGYITSVKDDRGRRTVMDLVKGCPERIFPVGRLDFDSEGLLLFTNDGDFTNKLIHPSSNKDKIYLVQVSDYYPDACDRLSEPMEIDGYKISPATVSLVSRDGKRAELEIIIHEGRNRQIRKMCMKCGLKVLKLRRIAIGALKLGNLEPGKWRYLTEEEVSMLINAR